MPTRQSTLRRIQEATKYVEGRPRGGPGQPRHLLIAPTAYAWFFLIDSVGPATIAGTTETNAVLTMHSGMGRPAKWTAAGGRKPDTAQPKVKLWNALNGSVGPNVWAFCVLERGDWIIDLVPC